MPGQAKPKEPGTRRSHKARGKAASRKKPKPKKQILDPISENSGFPSLDSTSRVVSLLEVFQPATIYLFGSASMGTAHPHSDVDLAFLPLQTCDPVEVFEMANRLADVLGREVDIIDLRRANTVMAKEVIRTGKLIAEPNSSIRKEFEMRALANYADLNIQRQPVLRKLAATTR